MNIHIPMWCIWTIGILVGGGVFMFLFFWAWLGLIMAKTFLGGKK